MTPISVPSELYTIGHSTHPIEHFIALLRQHSIEAVADVRSSPLSRHNPQFDLDRLSQSLRKAGLKYVFLGLELGARRQERECYRQGKVDYRLVARLPLFQHGLARLKSGSERMRIAIMCAESDPLECHRTILVAKEARGLFVAIKHILPSGEIEGHERAESRLLTEYGFNDHELFGERSVHLEEAYLKRAAEIAYAENSGQPVVNHG